MRKSVPILPPAPPAAKKARSDEERARAAEKVAAETAALVVGARVEGRYQASLPGIASSSLFRKTHWFPGMIQSVEADGDPPTYAILYDDGDFETGVKRRFVRLMRPEVAAQAAEEEEGLAQAAIEELGLAEEGDLESPPGGMPVGLEERGSDDYLEDDELPNDLDNEDYDS